MRYKVLGFLLVLFFLSCVAEKNALPEVVLTPPKMLQSSIVNGTRDVPLGEQTVIVAFDQNVTLSNDANITLNGTSVKKASAAFKELRIEVELVRATDYVLVIPANTIKGPTGIFAEPLQLTFTSRGSIHQSIKTDLVASNASKEARNVYEFLRKNYGEKIISGVMANVNWNTNEAEWVYAHTGKYPALNCFDYIHLYASPANWINYEQIQVVEDWWDKQGLVAAMWHWNVPAREGIETYGFYTNETSFDVSKAVIEGTYEHGVVMADLERIANHLVLLQEKNIPVIWRPLHEAAGGWFWWGAKGADPYKKLWVMMFEVFKEKGLNNIIWVWTSETKDDDWYPGDAYVDMVGVDLYDKTDAAAIASLHLELKETYPDKILALSEFGNVAALSSQWTMGATWSWMMPWYDYERTVQISGQAFDQVTHVHADIDYWNKVFSLEHVISRDQMPNLK